MGTLKIASHEKFPSEVVYSSMGINSDLVFVCRQGQKIFTNRALLCGQSKLLSELLPYEHGQGQGQAHYVTLADFEASHVDRALELLTTGVTHLKGVVMEVLDLLGVNVDKTTFEVFIVSTVTAPNEDPVLTMESNCHIISDDSDPNPPSPKKLRQGELIEVDGFMEQLEHHHAKPQIQPRGKTSKLTKKVSLDSDLSLQNEIDSSSGKVLAREKGGAFKNNIQAKELPDYDPCMKYQTLNDIPDDEFETMIASEGEPGSRERLVQFVHAFQMYKQHRSNKPRLCPYCPILVHRTSKFHIIRHLATHFKIEILNTAPRGKLQDQQKCFKCNEDLKASRLMLSTHLAVTHNALETKGIMPPLLRNFVFSIEKFRK